MISFLMASITNFTDVKEPYCLPAVSKHLQLWFFFYIYCDCQEKDYSFHILKRGYDKRQQPPATSETILYKCSGKVLVLVRYLNLIRIILSVKIKISWKKGFYFQIKFSIFFCCCLFTIGTNPNNNLVAFTISIFLVRGTSTTPTLHTSPSPVLGQSCKYHRSTNNREAANGKFFRKMLSQLNAWYEILLQEVAWISSQSTLQFCVCRRKEVQQLKYH